MSNFTIHYEYDWQPWLLLLIIPLLFLALWPHFRVAKKYRRTRNRIVSLVLHCVILVLSVWVLSGLTFGYDVKNDENEILLLVDVSHSSRESDADKDAFVKSVIDFSDSNYKVGVVTFGYDQVYAAPFSYDGDKVYNQYLNAKLPDISATDIEGALTYARSLLKYPETSKIVLISDGIETDGSAMSVIRGIAADGVHVDTKYFHESPRDEIEIVGVDLPDYTIVVNDTFNVSINLSSSFAGTATVRMYDNGELAATTEAVFDIGKKNVALQYAFTREGMHILKFEIVADGDNLTENNCYTSYIYLETFDKILVFERNAGESDKLCEILKESGYTINVVNILDTATVPSSLAELCAYDEIIMMNIANADMPEGFDELLHSYVYYSGGGMFTVGGNKIDVDGKETANAYNRDDMINTTYQRMLPVQAIDYTPPLGLVIIIDRSGSMSLTDSSGKSRLDAAKEGAYACLDVLSERDYCGVISLETDFESVIDITQATQKSRIREAIDKITLGGGTKFSQAIIAAGENLKILQNVERRHIILITDGQPGENKDLYEQAVINNFNANITLSIVGIGINEGTTTAINMTHLATDLGGGVFYPVVDLDTLRNVLRDDLTMDSIQQYVPTKFSPTIRSHTAAVAGITEKFPELGGFYGTRLKSDATQVLIGGYYPEGSEVPAYAVPIYAQWKYGAGNVGSFMCDLKGTDDSWSQEFMQSDVGILFINNVIRVLFPSRNIRPTDIRLELKEQNYRTQMSIFTTLASDEKIDVTLFRVSDDGEDEIVEQSFTAGAKEDYSRVTLTTTDAGVYRILVQKKNSSGDIISSASLYKTFSYSAEYDVFIDEIECQELLAALATYGKGNEIDGASEVFIDFFDKLHKVIDPRLAMIIIALILFLIDIAVRKFKFKWPHELIREYRNKKNSRQ
ncbi:MAG: VWA domain-containing protein [Clostridiales bacterium]|nr:VWA domain-containing protein [Clostridiales bacterium]